MISSPILTRARVEFVIEAARKAELRRDVQALQEILEEVWIDTTVEPNFSVYEPLVEAELLRLSGAYLTFSGNSALVKNKHLRAKDLLSKSIRIFEENQLIEKVVEANILLGFCYANCGDNDTFDAIYDYLEQNYASFLSTSMKVLMLVNRQMIDLFLNRIDKVIELAENSSFLISCCQETRLKAMYFTNLGIAYFLNEKPKLSIYYLNEAIGYCVEVKSKFMEATCYNSLAGAYLKDGNFDEAAYYSHKSIELSKKIKNNSLLANCLDTLASIHLLRNDFENAFEVIEKSVDLFSKGEDYNGYIQALWTKIGCLLKLERLSEALSEFIELINICNTQINEETANRYKQKFEKLIFIRKGLPIEEEVFQFEKELTREALLNTNGKIVEAAKVLGLDNYQALQYSLKHKFPDLKEEFNLKNAEIKKKESSKKKIVKDDVLNKKKPKTSKLKSHNGLLEKIKPVDLPSKIFSFDFQNPPKEIETFIADAGKLEKFGIGETSILAISPLEEIRSGKNVMIYENDERIVGIVYWDGFSKLHFIFDQNDQPIPVTTENVIGEFMAYCSLKEAKGEIIEFIKIANFTR